MLGSNIPPARNWFAGILFVILGLAGVGPVLGRRWVERGCSCKVGNALQAVKTASFSVLSGIVAPSYGDVHINGRNIVTRVGLQLARNKGMTGPAMKEAVESWVLRMDLADHAHKLA